MLLPLRSSFFFFNDTPTPEIYPLSLHDALPICEVMWLEGITDRSSINSEGRKGCLLGQRHMPWQVLAWLCAQFSSGRRRKAKPKPATACVAVRSEEHTSELQSHLNLVCRLLLEK